MKVYLLSSHDGAPGVQVHGVYSTAELAMRVDPDAPWEKDGDDGWYAPEGWLVEPFEIDQER